MTTIFGGKVNRSPPACIFLQNVSPYCVLSRCHYDGSNLNRRSKKRNQLSLFFLFFLKVNKMSLSSRLEDSSTTRSASTALKERPASARTSDLRVSDTIVLSISVSAQALPGTPSRGRVGDPRRAADPDQRYPCLPAAPTGQDGPPSLLSC
jgi:hypothetical protein